MTTHYSISRLAALVPAAALVALVAGCSKPPDQSNSSTAPETSLAQPLSTSQSTASKLGDLSAFRAIATEVSGIAQNGDLAAAKAHIKTLEVSWDSAEASLKPRAASDWHVLDMAIDKALSALRADPPNQNDANAAMISLLKVLDTLQGKAG